MRQFGHDGCVGQPMRGQDIRIPGIYYVFRLAYGRNIFDKTQDVESALLTAAILNGVLDEHAAQFAETDEE